MALTQTVQKPKPAFRGKSQLIPLFFEKRNAENLSHIVSTVIAHASPRGVAGACIWHKVSENETRSGSGLCTSGSIFRYLLPDTSMGGYDPAF